MDCYFCYFGFGLIGFIDDVSKLYNNNSRGISGKIRLIIGFFIAAFATIWVIKIQDPSLSMSLAVPIFKDVLLNLGWFYIPFAVFVIVGSANSVNLTDGLDGLAIMPVMIASGSLGIIAYAVGRIDFPNYLEVHYIAGSGEIAVFSAAILVLVLVLLVVYTPPAAVFMGDTGSLALGGALGAISVCTKHEIIGNYRWLICIRSSFSYYSSCCIQINW